MRISRETIRKVQETADILEVVEDFLTLKKSGKNWTALSPFSNEKTPSFFVVPSKNIFKDFSSGKGGDAISFIKEIEGIGFLEAVKYLANKYSIEIEEEETTPEQEEAQSKKESILIALNFANRFYKTNLNETDEGKSVGLSYFKERRIRQKALETFELGYSPDAWNTLEENALKNGFTTEILEQAGLVVQKENGKRYDRFRGRVMFPIHNVSGRVIGFGARTLKKDDKPKYLNSPETEVYHKSYVLYGIYQARNAIRKEDNCYLVEGYTDVISMHQEGIENVVSSSGTALTEAQVKILKRFSPNVTVLYDGDPAGIRASLRGIDLLLAEGLNVKIVLLPEGEDPDSFAQKEGGEKFKSYLQENAQDFILFKTDLFLKDASNDPIKKASLIRDVVESIIKIPDPIRRSVFFKQCSEQLGVAEELLISEGNTLLLKESKRKQRAREQEKRREERQNLQSGERYFEGIPLPSSENFAAPPQESTPLPSFEDDFSFSTEEDFEAELTTDLSQETVTHDTRPSYYQEREYLRLLITYGSNNTDGGGHLYQHMIAEAQEVALKIPAFQKMKEAYLDLIEREKIPSEMDFLHHDDTEVKDIAVDILTDFRAPSEHWTGKFQILVPKKDQSLEKIIYQNILRLKYAQLVKLCNEALNELKHAQDLDTQEEYLKIHSTLKKERTTIAKELGIVVG